MCAVERDAAIIRTVDRRIGQVGTRSSEISGVDLCSCAERAAWLLRSDTAHQMEMVRVAPQDVRLPDAAQFDGRGSADGRWPTDLNGRTIASEVSVRTGHAVAVEHPVRMVTCNGEVVARFRVACRALDDNVPGEESYFGLIGVGCRVLVESGSREKDRAAHTRWQLGRRESSLHRHDFVLMPVAAVLEGRRRQQYLLRRLPIHSVLQEDHSLARLHAACEPRPRSVKELPMQLHSATDGDALAPRWHPVEGVLTCGS